MSHQSVVHGRVHDSVDLGVDELHLRLRFKARIRQFNAENADQSFAHVVSGNGRVLVLKKAVLFCVLIDCPCQRSAESSEMGAAVRVRDRIRERQNLIVVAVVVLEDDIDKNFVALSCDHDRLGMQDLFVFAQLPNELFDSVFVKKSLLLWRIDAFIGERDLQTGIQKRQLAQARRQSFELELGRDRENRRVRQERDERACGLLVLDLADDC